MQASRRLLNLDILRLVSALLVLLFHYGFRMQLSGEAGGVGFAALAPFAMWFDTGLLIFFAISGYVIALSAQGRSAYDFAAGRFARLWPTFVVCCSLTALVLTVWPVPTLPAPTLKQWLAHAIILSRALGQPFLDGAYWTIAYEIIFYGWIFVLIALGLFERHWKPIVLIWLALSVCNEVWMHSGAMQKLLITQFSGFFAFGLALFRSRTERSAAAYAVLAAAALWATAGPFTTQPDFLATYAIARSTAALMLVGPAALAAVSLAVLAPALPIRKGLAVTLGGLTYPLYLLHQNIGYAVFNRFAHETDKWLVLAGLLAVLVLMALAIATWLEPPARRGLIRLAGHLRAKVSQRRLRAV